LAGCRLGDNTVNGQIKNQTNQRPELLTISTDRPLVLVEHEFIPNSTSDISVLPLATGSVGTGSGVTPLGLGFICANKWFDSE
ncbi:MAG: hypothetical protein KDD59_09715, partial [Bdellovibrionales bacterium]|nr:hypothetical protein [Bdellovibrionales bacterium]